MLIQRSRSQEKHVTGTIESPLGTHFCLFQCSHPFFNAQTLFIASELRGWLFDEVSY